ncbi:hypothetical protein B7494_g5079 [Chlorociboria aeruginascens]|nr:hypothetical protein B7494_g5079 [Chlorociboria aeruginascens]
MNSHTENDHEENKPSPNLRPHKQTRSDIQFGSPSHIYPNITQVSDPVVSKDLVPHTRSTQSQRTLSIAASSSTVSTSSASNHNVSPHKQVPKLDYIMRLDNYGHKTGIAPIYTYEYNCDTLTGVLTCTAKVLVSGCRTYGTGSHYSNQESAQRDVANKSNNRVPPSFGPKVVDDSLVAGFTEGIAAMRLLNLEVYVKGFMNKVFEKLLHEGVDIDHALKIQEAGVSGLRAGFKKFQGEDHAKKGFSSYFSHSENTNIPFYDPLSHRNFYIKQFLMLRTIPRKLIPLTPTRTLASVTVSQPIHSPRGSIRPEGDISAVFASLNNSNVPLPSRFADLKTALLTPHREEILSSWARLLCHLRDEIPKIKSAGSSLIPSIPFSSIGGSTQSERFKEEVKKYGVGIIKDAVSQGEALRWKEDIRRYIGQNPLARGFPKEKPAVWELYWAPSQVKARSHPNIVSVQKYLMSLWHDKGSPGMLDTTHPLIYADRLRIRHPGDVGFALGPHVDGGSLEQWEWEGYGKSGVYDKILQGRWEEHDMWDGGSRLDVESDLYAGAGGCEVFRMFQGWLSMSSASPGEGTLLVNPLFKAATAYILLRPFFKAKNKDPLSPSYLEDGNWFLPAEQTSEMQGAQMGHSQELSDALHPHLKLTDTMISLPKVEPGDFVLWHCDIVHAVDQVHKGKSDSSVLYIPAVPLTVRNAHYLVRLREAFLSGTPGPDFPGGDGEKFFRGRMSREDLERIGGEEALRAIGLHRWDGEGKLFEEVNDILGVTT